MPTVSIRVNDGDLTEIDRRARARGLTRTALLVDSALGRPPGKTDIEELEEEMETRLADHEARLERVEAVTFGSLD